MAGSFTVTISSLSALNIGGSKRSELCEIQDMMLRAMQAFVSSNGATTSFKDRQGNSAGTISWTPANAV
jgi:hypothetical protein